MKQLNLCCSICNHEFQDFTETFFDFPACKYLTENRACTEEFCTGFSLRPKQRIYFFLSCLLCSCSYINIVLSVSVEQWLTTKCQEQVSAVLFAADFFSLSRSRVGALTQPEINAWLWSECLFL